jgi:hypothetical protein
MIRPFDTAPLWITRLVCEENLQTHTIVDCLATRRFSNLFKVAMSIWEYKAADVRLDDYHH